MAIKYFRNSGTRDIAEGINSKSARRLLPVLLQKSAQRALFVIEHMTSLKEIAAFPGWRLERLKGDRAGQYSIRINEQYRVCFGWDGTDAEEVEIVDYH